jgi:hypothetical protein
MLDRLRYYLRERDWKFPLAVLALIVAVRVAMYFM